MALVLADFSPGELEVAGLYPHPFSFFLYPAICSLAAGVGLSAWSPLAMSCITGQLGNQTNPYSLGNVFSFFHYSSGRALDGIWIFSITLFRWGMLTWSLCTTLYCQCKVFWFILVYRTLQTSSACFPSLSSKIDCVLSLKSEGFITNFCNISLGMTIANISSFRAQINL